MMKMYSDSIWGKPLHELRNIAEVDGKDKLFERLVLTEAYTNEPAKMAFKLFLQMDDTFQLFIIQSLVESLANTEQSFTQSGVRMNDSYFKELLSEVRALHIALEKLVAIELAREERLRLSYEENSLSIRFSEQKNQCGVLATAPPSAPYTDPDHAQSVG